MKRRTKWILAASIVLVLAVGLLAATFPRWLSPFAREVTIDSEAE